MTKHKGKSKRTVKRKSVRTHFLVVSILCLLLFLGYLFFRLQNVSFTDTLTELYSNGWYDFTFKYPQNALVVSDEQTISGEEVTIKKNAHENLSSCILNFYNPEDSYGALLEKSGYNDLLTINNTSWKKSYIEDGGIVSVFNGFKVTDWVTKANGYYVDMLANKRSDESFCEKILSSIRFSTDDSFYLAHEAKKAKIAAVSYIKDVYPDKKFISGYFINDSGEQISLGENSLQVNKAFVVASKTVHSAYPEPKYLTLENDNGNWIVTNVSSDPTKFSK